MEWLDSAGYPTSEALEKVRSWDVGGTSDCADLLKFVGQLWYYPNYFEEKDGVYQISTGGWSGNEDVIGAMYTNVIFNTFCWRAHWRGGHYIYMLPSMRVDVEFVIRRKPGETQPAPQSVTSS